MLGLEILLTPRSLETLPSADIYLQEIQDTCVPLKLNFSHGWTVCCQEIDAMPRLNRHWRIWTANYPYGWLKEIAYSDWDIPTRDDFHRVPWVTLFRSKMPTRTASFKFWWWLRKKGYPMDFSSSHPMMDGKSYSI